MSRQSSLKFIHAINKFGYAIPYFEVIKQCTPNVDSETQAHLNCMLTICCLFCLLHKGVHKLLHTNHKNKKKTLESLFFVLETVKWFCYKK